MFIRSSAIIFALGLLSSFVDAAPLMKRSADNGLVVRGPSAPTSALSFMRDFEDINNEGQPDVTPIPDPEAHSPPQPGPAPGEIINNEGQPDVTPIANPEAPSPPQQAPPPNEIINNEGVPDIPGPPGTPTASITTGDIEDITDPFVATNIPFPNLDGPPINNEGQPDVTPIADPEAPSPPQQGPPPGAVINNEGQPDVTPIADPEAPSPPQQGPPPGSIINNEGVPDIPGPPGTPVATFN